MKNCVFLLLLISFSATGTPTYDWAPERKPYVLSDREKSLPEYALLVRRHYEYEWNNAALTLVQTDHRIVRVGNSEAIQRNNRIYISMNGVKEVVDLKARAITPSGKVVNFDRNNLKEVKDENVGQSYKIFAIEGIEINSEVEYFYTLRKQGRAFESFFIQEQVPIREAGIQVTAPVPLHFALKFYNDSIFAKEDTLKGKRYYRYDRRNIPGLPKENFSAYDANRIRMEMKLTFNYYSGKSRLNTWADAGKIFYKSMFTLDRESEKAIDKFVKNIHDNKSASIADRIRSIESQIKKSNKLIPQSGVNELEYLPAIIVNRQANQAGMTRLLIQVYLKLGIPVHLVLTCDREKAKFDDKSENWNFLDDYLLYFPDANGFVAPGNEELLYPMVDSKFTAQKGLFVEPVSISGVNSAIALIKEIPALPYTANTDNLDISIRFNDSMDQNTVFLTRIFLGYEAAYLTHYYVQMTQEQREKMVFELLKTTAPDMVLTKWNAIPGMNNGISQFTVDLEFVTGHFLERAGPKILFNVGDLIGPQSELYRDDNRQTDVENTNNRGYDRKITIAIPAGYQVSNEEALKMDVKYQDGDRTPFLFESSYLVDKGVVSVTIREYYKEIYAPLSRYEDFRKVINAAADFNKVKLLMNRK